MARWSGALVVALGSLGSSAWFCRSSGSCARRRRSRRSLVKRSFEALSSACHLLVSSGSLQPKIRASQRIFSLLIPLSLSWNQLCTVRKSMLPRLPSMPEIASARDAGVQGPSGNPRWSTGRPAPSAARRENNTLKLSLLFCGATKYLPFFNKLLRAFSSLLFVSIHFLSCVLKNCKHNYGEKIIASRNQAIYHQSARGCRIFGRPT